MEDLGGGASGDNQDTLPPHAGSQLSINPAGLKGGKAGHLQNPLAPNLLPLPHPPDVRSSPPTAPLQTLGVCLGGDSNLHSPETARRDGLYLYEGKGWHALRVPGSVWKNPYQDPLPAPPLFPNARVQLSAPGRGAGIDSPTSHSISVSSLVGRGSQEAKNGERLGVQKGRSTPASRPSAAQPQWKPGQQPGSGNQRVRARARAPTVSPGRRVPSSAQVGLTLQTPCSHPGSSSFHAPYLAPPESPSQRAPHLGHPMSFEPCVWVPHLLCTPCQKNPTPSVPALRIPHV